jgi:DnaJ-class molecular chaperone
MDWRSILDLPEAVTLDEIVARHRCLAKKYHPDVGGDVEAMQTINAAKAAAIEEVTGKKEGDGFGPMIRWPKRRRRHKRKTRR